VVEIHPVNSIDGPKFIDKTPLDEGLPCRFSPERSSKQVIPELNEKYFHVPMNDASLNVDVKSHVKKICKEGNKNAWI